MLICYPTIIETKIKETGIVESTTRKVKKIWRKIIDLSAISVKKEDIIQETVIKTLSLKPKIKQTIRGGKAIQSKEGWKKPSLDLIESFNESEDIYKNDINFDDIRPMIEKDIDLVEIIENENTTDEDNHNNINKYIISVNHMQETEEFEEIHEWYYDTDAYEHIINNKSF